MASRPTQTQQAVARPTSARTEQQCERYQTHPDGEERQVNQSDDAHVASGSGERRGCRGIGQVGLGTVLIVVPAVVQSHPASVARAPRP